MAKGGAMGMMPQFPLMRRQTDMAQPNIFKQMPGQSESGMGQPGIQQGLPKMDTGGGSNLLQEILGKISSGNDSGGIMRSERRMNPIRNVPFDRQVY